MEMHYRTILNEVFRERSLANSSYSLRAFARDIQIAPSTISEILNGKKGLSPKLARSVAQSLRLPDWEVEYFCDLVTQEHAKSPRVRNEAKQRLKEKRQENKLHILNQNAMRSLTSWIDLAVLEVTHLSEFQGSASWISKKLNVEESIVRDSVKRLVDSRLLEINDKSGAWRDVSPLFSSTDGINSESIRKFHRSVLNLALKNLEIPDVNARSVKSVVFSVSEENGLKAQRILNEAILKIVALADQKHQKRSDVMCFSGQLFSLLNKGASK
nr:hypothetical protein HAGR004_40930 [Bdellovibrio sp. HAGR004]